MKKYFCVENLCYAYLKKSLCLRDISFSACKKDKVLVLGLDDQGKSTLIKTISGFDEKYFGRVYLESVDIKTIADQDKKISLILSYPTLIDGSINENLDFLFETFGELVPSEDEKLKLLKLFNLNYNLDVNVKKLSIFEKFKLCFLRVYIKQPKIVFIDDFLGYNFSEIEMNEIFEIITMLTKDSLMFMCSNDKNFLQHKSFFNAFEWSKILYLNMTKLHEKQSLAEFLNSPIDLDALAFCEDFVSKECYCVFQEGNYYLSIDDIIVKMDKSLNIKFEALKLGDCDNEDMVLAHKKGIEVDFVNNNDINKMIADVEILLFSKLDRTRIN